MRTFRSNVGGRSWRQRIALVVGALGATTIVATVGATPSFADAPIDGPNAAHIIQFFSSSSGDRVPYRTGRAEFGDVHIKAGGSRKKTENHETTTFAKQQWQAALNNRGLAGRFGGGRIYSAQYQTSGGTFRTMCVIVDTNDFNYAQKNYGYKGIITAFWLNGHVATGECNSAPDD